MSRIVRKTKKASTTPSDLEDTICNHLEEIEKKLRESNNKEFINVISKFVLSSAKEITNTKGNSVVLINVPYKAYRVVRGHISDIASELEKKLAKHVIMIADRTIVQKNKKLMGSKIRPMNRTLTKVQEAQLDDIVAPCEISGKRTKMSTDQSALLKVFLSTKESQRDSVESKLASYEAAYKHLTSKNAQFILSEA